MNIENYAFRGPLRLALPPAISGKFEEAIKKFAIDLLPDFDPASEGHTPATLLSKILDRLASCMRRARFSRAKRVNQFDTSWLLDDGRYAPMALR